MTPTLRRKLEALAERREELERLLADPGVIGDSDRFRSFSREFSQLEPVATAMAEEKRAQADLSAAQAMRGDPELAELADEEIATAQQRLAQLDDELMLLLLPPLWRTRDRRYHASAPVVAIAGLLAAGALIAALLELVPSESQRHLQWLLLMVPLNLALSARLLLSWRRAEVQSR